jgi:hypothetical protein
MVESGVVTSMTGRTGFTALLGALLFVSLTVTPVLAQEAGEGGEKRW